MRKKIFIHCEITKREFDAKLLLATLAANKNFDVFLGNITGLENKVNLPPGIFHHTSCVPSKSILSLFKRLKKKNFLITTQDEEGGVEETKNFFSKPPRGTFYYRYGPSSFKLVDAVFTWSNIDFNHIIKRFPKYKSKIYNTGNPRADIWTKNLKDIYRDNKYNSKYILISSHTDGPSSNKTLLENLQIMRKAYFDKNEIEFEDKKIHLFENLSSRSKYMYVFINTIIKLSNEFKNEKFIFRPHPTESLELWKFLFRNCKNIKVTKDNSSTYWMHKSKILIQNGNSKPQIFSHHEHFLLVF